MPSEYMGKTGAAFDWTLYEENIEPQKKIVNAFVKRFAEFEQSGRGLYIYSKCKDLERPSWHVSWRTRSRQDVRSR